MFNNIGILFLMHSQNLSLDFPRLPRKVKFPEFFWFSLISRYPDEASIFEIYQHTNWRLAIN